MAGLGHNGGPELDPDEVALVELMAECQRDPLAFVLAAFPWGEGELEGFDGPDEWAVDILGRIRDGLMTPAEALQAIQVAVASGHGIGKSACIAWIFWWSLCTMEDTKGIITANTEQQLRTKTWPEIAKWYRFLICRHWFVLTDTAAFSVDPEHSKTWRFDRVTWSEHNTEAFAGLHNIGKRIVLLFDEASNIADKVWEVAEGALTDKETEIVWVAYGNPTRNTGRFWSAFHGKLRHLWSTRKVDSRSVKVTNKAQLAKMVDTWGEESDIVKVRVRGEFPSASTLQFIPSDAVKAARLREVTWYKSDPIILGVDVARYGDDKSTIYVRRGRDFRYRAPIRIQGKSTMVLVARVAELYRELDPDAIFVDGGGVGGPVIDRLRELQIPVIEIHNGSPSTKRDYANLGTECWGNFRDLLPDIAIPDDDDLETDLCGREYGYDKHNRFLLESKDDMRDRGLSSPDDADGICLCCAYPVGPRDPRKDLGLGHVVASEQGRSHSDYDPYA
jgi:hypothetical protein